MYQKTVRCVLLAVLLLGLLTVVAWGYPTCDRGCLDINGCGAHPAVNESPPHECHVHCLEVGSQPVYGPCCGMVGEYTTQYRNKHWFDCNFDLVADCESQWAMPHMLLGC